MVSFLFTGDVLLKPIVDNAGNDISHWFNPKTKDVSIQCVGLKKKLVFKVNLICRYIAILV